MITLTITDPQHNYIFIVVIVQSSISGRWFVEVDCSMPHPYKSMGKRGAVCVRGLVDGVIVWDEYIPFGNMHEDLPVELISSIVSQAWKIMEFA